MSYRYLLAAALILPATASAQQTCSLEPVIKSGMPSPVFAACATDRPARIREGSFSIPYPEVLRAAGIRPITDPVVLLIIDSTGTPVPSSVLVGAGPNHPGFKATILRAVQQWRFDPALKGGHPVASSDTIRIEFPAPPGPLVLRDCFDCDTWQYAAQVAVDLLRERFSTCAAALGFVGRYEVADSTIWAMEQLPTCPGASEAAVLALRMEKASWSGSSMRNYWVRLAGRVRSPEVFSTALETARGGSRSAFRVLALQLTGWARVQDSLPVRWDEGRGRPRTACGPMKLVPPLEGSAQSAIDSSQVRRALQLADSVVDGSETAPGLRVAAWCLSAQLR